MDLRKGRGGGEGGSRAFLAQTILKVEFLRNEISGILKAYQRVSYNASFSFFDLGDSTKPPTPPPDQPQKYPQNEYPGDRAVSENQKRTKQEQEFELTDTGECDYNEKLLNQVVPVTKNGKNMPRPGIIQNSCEFSGFEPGTFRSSV